MTNELTPQLLQLQAEDAVYYDLTNGRKLKSNNVDSHKKKVLQGYNFIKNITLRGIRVQTKKMMEG